MSTARHLQLLGLLAFVVSIRSRPFSSATDVVSTVDIFPTSNLLEPTFAPTLTAVTNNSNNSGGGGGGVPLAVWLPILILVILSIALMVLFRGSFFPKLKRWGSTLFVPSHVPVPTPGPQVLTAEQLAGSMVVRDANDAAAAASGEARPPRRRRRPRRTPSQVSTKSLPAYMLEPGDQELVLVRARQATVDENEAEDEEAGMEDVSTPLLADGPSGSPSTSLAPPVPGNTQDSLSIRPSIDSHLSSYESHETMHSSQSLLEQERGEAPPYFEVVEAANGQQVHQALNSLSEEAVTPLPTPPPSNFQRFRRFFPWGATTAQQHEGEGLPGAGSGLPMRQYQSQVSLPLAQTGSPTRPRRSSQILRSNPSLSNLLLSRTRSNSQVSPQPPHVISGPVPHSVIRTSFGYPSAGPTPEQMAFISSTASLVRFGVPLNDDGTEVTRPPPTFDSVVPRGASESPAESPASSTPSNLTPPGIEARRRSDSESLRRQLFLNTRSTSETNANLGAVEELPTPLSPAFSTAKHDSEMTTITNNLPPLTIPATTSPLAVSRSASVSTTARAAAIPLPSDTIGSSSSSATTPIAPQMSPLVLGVQTPVSATPSGTWRTSASTFTTAHTHISGPEEVDASGDETETEFGVLPSRQRTATAGTTPAGGGRLVTVHETRQPSTTS